MTYLDDDYPCSSRTKGTAPHYLSILPSCEVRVVRSLEQLLLGDEGMLMGQHTTYQDAFAHVSWLRKTSSHFDPVVLDYGQACGGSQLQTEVACAQ